MWSLVIGEHISLFKSAFFVGFISIFDPKATVFPFFSEVCLWDFNESSSSEPYLRLSFLADWSRWYQGVDARYNKPQQSQDRQILGLSMAIIYRYITDISR
jgi:hypothetical protein